MLRSIVIAMKHLLKLSLFFVVFSSSLSAQENHSVIGSGSLIPGLTGSKFDVAQNNPNPFVDYTEIGFSSPLQGFVEFKMVNLLGKEVCRKVIDADSGINKMRVEADDFIPGVYIYSLSNGSQTITRRMIISKK